MFGVLRGNKCAMGSELWSRWAGHVCGVCATLKDHYGQTSRLAMNFDAALISVLCEAQDHNPQHRRTHRCLLRRSSEMKITSPSNPGAQYAASMALVAASTRIEDHVRDGETFLSKISGVSIKIAQRWKQAARRTAKNLDFDTQIITTQAQRQGEVEARPNQGFAFYARPTELSVGAVFGHTAVLANAPQNAGVLFDIGRLYGRIMVLLDSYQDRSKDLSLGRFNALAASYAGEEAEQQAGVIFHRAFQRIKQLFNQLDLPQPLLASDLLMHQLPRVGHKTLNISERAVWKSQLPGRHGPVSLDGASFSWKDCAAGSGDGKRVNQRSSSPRMQTSGSGEEAPKRRCPHCGWFVDDSAVTCVHCGREIAPAVAAGAEKDPEEKHSDRCCECYDQNEPCFNCLNCCCELGICLECCGCCV